MSNINNKHIPEDLDSLTRKDMVELFKIQVEEHQGFIKEIESLSEQLAKANERVNRLEKILQRYESEQLQPLKLRVKELEKELANKELLHVGFTNGSQIKYAKVEEGAFYPDTGGDCYIPLYMLKSHEHRIDTTSIEQLRKEQ